MHGPYIKENGAAAKRTYLIAIIDDATRLITGASFFFSEATVNKEVLRTAVLTYGIPSRLFLDNGRNFRAEDIGIGCAMIKCALIHLTAY